MALINKRACRKFMLDYAERLNKPLTRVQEDTYGFLEVATRKACRYAVENSVGKTVALTTKKKDD